MSYGFSPHRSKKDAKWKYYAFVAAVILVIIVGLQAFWASRDIDGWVYRAQVAADAEKMAQRLNTATANMERYNMTYGHAALIFHTPDNDVGLDYEALGDLQSRAERIAEYGKGSTEYQVALDDMRGTLREIDVDADYFTIIHSPLTYIAAILVIAAVVQFFRE